jgi:hypothetical protein
VTTWGYPFVYNGTSPLLSVGYVAGYRSVSDHDKSVKHIIVNGAFNHGNSGGPLLVSHTNDVIGIVVSTHHFYPPLVKQIIDLLEKQTAGFQFQATLPNGDKEAISDLKMTGMVLNEFYQKTQVVIGEAIAATELTMMINEKSAELSGVR